MGRVPHHLPPLQKTIEITMFSMILGLGQGPHHLPPPSKVIGNQYVFYDFGGGAGCPSPPASPKPYGNHYVFKDFGGGARPLSPPTCDHYRQVVRKPDPDLVPNLVPTLCQAPPTRFSMGCGRRVLPAPSDFLKPCYFLKILQEVGGSGSFPQPQNSD